MKVCALAGLVAGSLAGLAAPVAAQTGCITQRDLSRGIEVAFATGEVFTLRRTGNGYIETLEDYRDGSNPILLTGRYGVYIFEEYEVENGAEVPGSSIKIDFMGAEVDLPRPAPGVSWAGPTLNVFPDGGTRPERFSARFVAGSPLVVDGCSYDVIEGQLRYEWPQDSTGGMTLVYHYIPQWGAAYLSQSYFDTEDPTRPYDVTGITRASK